MPFNDFQGGGRSDIRHNINRGNPLHRPECVSGFEPSGSGSTSLKWGSDGELNPLDLHKVLARLCLHDHQICEQLDAGPGSG